MKQFAAKPLVVAAATMSIVGLILAAATSTRSAQYSARDYERDLRAILAVDQRLKPDDLSLWPKVADITRRLARNAGVRAANEALDRVFNNAPSKKLYSHVWAVLPGSTIQGLAAHTYRADYDTYGIKTEFPKIRQDLLAFVSANPSDPYVEFGYYALGDFEKAVNERPNSPIADVLHHAIGFKIIGTIVKEAYLQAVGRTPRKPSYDRSDSTDRMLTFLNQHPELYDNKPLATVVSRFAERAAAAQPHFEFVLRDPKSPIADDAAYMLGWLAYHQGHYEPALDLFIRGMTAGNGDYQRDGAVKQTVRIFELTPTGRQYTILKANATLANQVPLWYVAARSAYRNFDYPLTIEIAEAALKKANLSPDRLPVTTDPELIQQAIKHEQVRKDWKSDANLDEIVYLLAASREHQQYLSYVASMGRDGPDRAMLRARAIILKYSQLLDQPEPEPTRRGRLARAVVHKDLRQAVHLIDATLTGLPRDQSFTRMREWLHYRKVRILAVFAPKTVNEAVVAMENDVPSSRLLNNALAEQVYAEGFMLGDLSSARQTFAKLTSKYPNGNAVDNAYTWMAISYRCAGRSDEAQAINKEIIRRFPGTRHAAYAVERMGDPSTSEGCPFSQELE
jgi:tetratricopeptide (TPR) repeat protein